MLRLAGGENPPIARPRTDSLGWTHNRICLVVPPALQGEPRRASGVGSSPRENGTLSKHARLPPRFQSVRRVCFASSVASSWRRIEPITPMIAAGAGRS